jgi:uncharacterized membrane protein
MPNQTLLKSKPNQETLIKFVILAVAILMVILAMNFFPTVGYAQEDIGPLDPCATLGGCMNNIDQFNQGEGTGGISKFLGEIIKIGNFIVPAIAVIVMIIGGYKMMTSDGDEKKYKSGLDTIAYAIIGLAIVILAGTVITLIISFSKGSFF